jgi:Ca2+:H+ antiporter
MKKMDNLFLVLLAFIPIALVAKYLNFSPLLIFFLAALAIIPIAKYIGEATEELTVYTGPAWGGFLNATFGNATEIIIGIIALNAGLIEVVKASITGSIIGNLLLVSGMAIFAGGFKYKKQVFNRTGTVAAGSTLFLATIALIIPAIFTQVSGASGTLVNRLSVFVAIFMLIAYIAYLFFVLFTHKHLFTEDVGKVEAKWSITKSIVILLIATLAVAWMSDILVSAIQPVVTQLGWTQLFVGVIFVAIIGNAAEHVSAITTALKNRMDLSLQISIGSATQIAMFAAPILVLISLFFKTQMNLVFNNFELVAMIVSVLIINLIVADGESNWFEGAQLLIAYAIIAVAFFFHP